jgi:HAD superfamily hydrolase (TIGR01509 family)
MADTRARLGRLVRPAALLFDLDGTVADSFAAITHALNAALREARLREHDLAWVRRHVGRGAGALVADAVGESAGAASGRVLSRYSEIYEEVYLAQTPPLPGALEALALAAERTDRRVAIISNKYERLCRALLGHWGVASLVAAVVGPDTYGVGKPDPAVVRPVLERFAVAPSDALIVGDMEVDAATGRAAGVPVLGVRGQAVSPEELRAAGMVDVIASLLDLPAWLAANGDGWR